MITDAEPLNRPVRPSVSSLWFTSTLPNMFLKDLNAYERTLSSYIQDSIVERKLITDKSADYIKQGKDRVEALEEQLKRAKEQLEEERRSIELEKVVHDTKHEGLVELLSKVNQALWRKNVE
ncbi:hypothetical protein J4E93_006946 [Alternaria ventricosa]|uniref:uncharacterized protein n=1 Tax=Alternaria ventricosa TaxID=1187951 RepID=UPI0020C5A051|nr:uncharacterized protein J4E93_006946 [Alternaria ventricosa]KAI4642877.1 hypothetical protein J4E93_006946 [Alternaria ventricosa]